MGDKLPDLMFFCEKGHLVAATDETALVEMNQIPPCLCGSRHLRAVENWPKENIDIVPLEPINSDKISPEVTIDVFDIGKLFAPWFEASWDINLDDFPADLAEKF